jgi:formylglycine-generating enzyme required for sulfatase activity
MPKPTDRALTAQVALLKRLVEQGKLSEEDYRRELADLGVEPAAVFDQRQQQAEEQINLAGDYLDQSQAGATYHIHIEHADELAIGDQAQVESREPKGTTALDDATAKERYLHHVIEANRCLQLQGIRSAGGLVSIELEEIYVTLNATVQKTVAAEEDWVKDMARLAPGEAKRAERMRPRETLQQTKVQVQEALAMYPRLVVLGDPGSGKTTLLRYLALTFARNQLGEDGLVEQRLQLKVKFDVRRKRKIQEEGKPEFELIAKWKEEQRLPILLPLRDFARFLETEQPDIGADGPKLLMDYLHIYFANQDIALPEQFFANRLRRGECVVLFDGMDEVATFATRQRVARIIERFTLTYPDNRYVVTSRIVGYTGGARLGEGYAVTTVRDFTQADVERFAAFWNRAVEISLAGEKTPYALREAERQTQTLLRAIQANERVRELAVNPLLLTVIALVQRYRAQLPERRSELYEEAVEVLLVQWDAVKGLSATAVLQGLELDAGDRRSLLEPVALWMMEQRAREIEAGDLRRQLEPSFFRLTQDQRRASKAVDGFLQLVNERSGLLAERGQGMYSFSHLTFQEHLAARAVADRDDYIAYALERLSDSWWREVILLEAGYLSTQGKRRVTELIRAIMDCPNESELYHNLVLAAETLHDVGPARTTGDLDEQIRGRLRQAFAEPMRRGQDLSDVVRRRAAAAEALGRIESAGFGAQPAFWRLPYGEPVWVDVPAGEFWMGGEREHDGQPVHRLYLERFQIARVPVTNTQYHFFVEAAGYAPPKHWEDGQIPRGLESHPVVYVSWRDAIAYCRWLAEATGKLITLPSEAEWEKAARCGALPCEPEGGGARIYPWGDEWDETKCNTAELGLSSTTPVGIFPEGASLYGCLDMVGNVWEWTRSRKKKYPYKPKDGRENLEAGDDVLQILRGGAADVDRNSARCTFRSWSDPDDRWDDIGFRVCVAAQQD